MRPSQRELPLTRLSSRTLAPVAVGIALGLAIVSSFTLPVSAAAPVFVASLLLGSGLLRSLNIGGSVLHEDESSVSKADSELDAAVRALHARRIEEAEAKLGSLVDADHPSAERAALNLGILRGAAGDVSGAADAFRNALEAKDVDTAARAALGLGIVTVYEDDPETLSAAFRDALDARVS